MELLKNIQAITTPILTLLLSLGTIIVVIRYIFGLKKVKRLEDEIFETKSAIDNMEKTLHPKTAGYVNQSQFDKIVERERKPLLAKLESLKLKRQFLVEKITLLGFFKR